MIGCARAIDLVGTRMNHLACNFDMVVVAGPARREDELVSLRCRATVAVLGVLNEEDDDGPYLY